MTTIWQQVSEACPRGRWRRDTDVDSCEQSGCSIRFGRFGLPGLSWSTTTTTRTTSASNYAIDSSSSPFSRTTSASSVDSLSIKTSVESGSPTKESPKDNNSILSSSLFAPLRLVDSFTGSLTSATNIINKESPSTLLPSICTSSASPSSTTLIPVPPSTPTLLTSPRSSIFGSSTDSNNGNSSRTQSISSAFSIPGSPIKLHRRHHCRRCGSCFCSDHSSHTATLTLATEDISLSTLDEMARLVIQPGEPPSSISTTFPSSTNFFSSSSLSSSPPLASSSQSHYIRARVCDNCYTIMQRAKNRLQDSPSPPQAAFLSLVSGWSTPTIMEDEDEEEEFFDSLERIRRESKREQHEALKVLCNDFTANRLVAKAVEGGDLVRDNASPLIDCGQSLQPDYHLAMGGQLATATLWEKAELKRKNGEVAKRAMSVDCFTLDGLDDDEEWNVDLQAVLARSRQSIFDRRCNNRPPSPQPIKGLNMTRDIRRGSADDTITSSTTPSTSPSSCTGVARMGASRLQRSFDSSQRSNKPMYPPRRASRPADNK